MARSSPPRRALPDEPSPAQRYAEFRRRAAAERTELGAFAPTLGFELDPFQLEACEAVERGQGVLVAAPTGAGKTVVGEFAVVSPGPRSATVTALEPTETMMLDRESFAGLRRQRPDINDYLVNAYIAEVRRLSAALLDALYLPVDKRVLRRVLELGELYGNDDTICVPLGQDDIAQIAGVTRQTVNKVLTKAQQDGVLHIERGRLEILDLGEIRRRCR